MDYLNYGWHTDYDPHEKTGYLPKVVSYNPYQKNQTYLDGYIPAPSRSHVLIPGDFVTMSKDYNS